MIEISDEEEEEEVMRDHIVLTKFKHCLKQHIVCCTSPDYG